MKAISPKAKLAALILLGASGGAFSFVVSNLGDEAREFETLREIALCVMELPEKTTETSAEIRTTQPIEKFHIAIRTNARDKTLSIVIDSDRATIASASGLGSGSFGLGRAIPPGIYTVTLHQEEHGKGATVVIASEEPDYLTGWQIWSRSYVGLLALTGIVMVLWRNETGSSIRPVSSAAFNSLLLGLVLIFTYLLFHEGGHALAQIAFGRFDLGRSDFWGLHGHPQSGSRLGTPIAPWQQLIISCAGPMLPTFAGFALFLLWRSRFGQKVRSMSPMVNMYFSAMVAILVFAEAVCEPMYLLGLIKAEGDLVGHVMRASGPVWLVRGFLWSIFLVSTFILWQVLPEIRKAYTVRFFEPPVAAANRQHSAEAQGGTQLG
jgi:hypothetical protein